MIPSQATAVNSLRVRMTMRTRQQITFNERLSQATAVNIL
jgi:hypothetical protein